MQRLENKNKEANERGSNTSLWPERPYISLLRVYTCVMTITLTLIWFAGLPPPTTSSSPRPSPCSNPEVKGRDLDVVVQAEVKLGSKRGPTAFWGKEMMATKPLSIFLLDQNSCPACPTGITWGGSDAQAAGEVLFESSEDGRHVRLHLVQVDDVPHQSRVDADLGRLALGLCWRDQTGEGKRESSRYPATVLVAGVLPTHLSPSWRRRAGRRLRGSRGAAGAWRWRRGDVRPVAPTGGAAGSADWEP